MLFVGNDWAEDHHDVAVQDEAGRRLSKARLPEGVVGIARLHELLRQLGGEDMAPEPVLIGIETDRGPWVSALVAASYSVIAVNPRQVARYRRDSALVEGLKVVARAHQTLIWERQRHLLRLRAALRDYFPAAVEAFDDLAGADALELLVAAADPASAARLSRTRIVTALRRARRRRRRARPPAGKRRSGRASTRQSRAPRRG